MQISPRLLGFTSFRLRVLAFGQNQAPPAVAPVRTVIIIIFTCLKTSNRQQELDNARTSEHRGVQLQLL